MQSHSAAGKRRGVKAAKYIYSGPGAVSTLNNNNTMENSTTHSLKSLIQDPSQLTDIMKDPASKGLEFYQGLSVKEQQYIIFAAAAGLVAYGLYLGRRK